MTGYRWARVTLQTRPGAFRLTYRTAEGVTDETNLTNTRKHDFGHRGGRRAGFDPVLSRLGRGPEPPSRARLVPATSAPAATTAAAAPAAPGDLDAAAGRGPPAGQPTAEHAPATGWSSPGRSPSPGRPAGRDAEPAGAGHAGDGSARLGAGGPVCREAAQAAAFARKLRDGHAALTGLGRGGRTADKERRFA